MDFINNNPYRVLGVYSNSPIRERVANNGKINAFLRVGKQVSFPLDLPNLLSPIERDVVSVADAEAKLTLPVDQIRYAQFWWMNASPLDGIAFNHLFAGNADMAKSIWQKKDDVSSLQNRIVMALIQEDYPTAIRCAEVLYSRFSEDLAAKVVGENFTFNMPLWKLFFDILLESGVKVKLLTDNITVSDWSAYVVQKTIAPLVNSITQAIATAKASKSKGSSVVRLRAGQKLMSGTKKMLTQLKKLIPTTDIRYQTVADKLATEILQCGIDYYNDTDDDDAPSKAMKLQQYALSIAVGSMAKQRCKENVDILQKTIDSLPPLQVMKQYREVQKELAKYCKLPDKICHAVTLLNATKAPLKEMKKAIGATHAAYLRLSTQVVSNALHNIIEEVNSVQSSPLNIVDKYLVALLMKNVLEKAWEATLLMDKFDMEMDFKANRYDKNKRILKDLCEQFGISVLSGSSKPRSSSTSKTASQSATGMNPQSSSTSSKSISPDASSVSSPVRKQPHISSTSKTVSQSVTGTKVQKTSPSPKNNPNDENGCISELLILVFGVLIGCGVFGGIGAIIGAIIALGIIWKFKDKL